MNATIGGRSRSTDASLRSNSPLSNRLVRGFASALGFRPLPRAFVPRRFGAKLGKGCHIDPRARIWLPSNPACEDITSIADVEDFMNQAPPRAAGVSGK